MRCKCGEEIDCVHPNAVVNNKRLCICKCGKKHQSKEHDFDIDWTKFAINIKYVDSTDDITVWVAGNLQTDRQIITMRKVCKSDTEVAEAVAQCLAELLHYVRSGV